MSYSSTCQRVYARRSSFAIVSLGLSLVVLSLLSACSLAGDVTPPPGQSASSVTSVAPQPTSVPTAITNLNVSQGVPPIRPSAAEGAVLYADHCADCHGPTGNGGGAMTPQLPGPVPDFSSPELVRSTTPQVWFQKITDGNLEQLMPPFGDSLSEIERWDLVAFLHTLSTPQEQMDRGQVVYESTCASCHGAEGQGDGAEAGGQSLPDLSDSSSAWTLGLGDLFTSMLMDGGSVHKFDASLSDADRWAALDYARAFSYDYLAPGALPTAKIGAITGAISNGTAGATIPAGLLATLFSFDDLGQMTTVTATVDATGAFQFDAVAYLPGQQFIVATDYQDMSYHSEPVRFVRGQDQLDVTVNVYETTSDPAHLRVEQMHMFVEFATADAVTLGQLFIFSNDGDTTYAALDGRALEFALPSGASELTVQDGQENVTYFLTEAGFVDSQPVLPGSGTAQVLFWYTLPYAGALNFEQKMFFPVNALNVLVSDLNVQLAGTGFQDQGAQEIQGARFQSFVGGGLAAGENLAFDISGKPGATTATVVAPESDTLNLALGAGALAAVLLAGGWWWYRRSQTTRGDSPTRDDFIQAIAELDDDYAAGEMDQRSYERERQELKGELLKLLKTSARQPAHD